MINNFNVCICTKGRYGTYESRKNGPQAYARVIKNIYDHALKNDLSELDRCYLVIESDDINGYTENYPKWPKKNILILGDHNQGIAFARESALHYFKEILPTELVFMMDDDVSLVEYCWKEHEKLGKLMHCGVRRDSDILSFLDKFVTYSKQLPEWDKVGVSSCEYTQFGWCKVPNFPDHELVPEDGNCLFSNYGYNDCVVLLKPLLFKELGISYDVNCKLREDRDLVANCNAHGLYGRKIYKFMIDSPLNGTTKGGCHDTYATDGMSLKTCQYLEEKWKEVCPKTQACKVIEKKTCYGRNEDAKFYWGRIAGAAKNNQINLDRLTYTNPKNLYNVTDLINYNNLYTK